MTNPDIYGITHPARYASHAFFSDGREEAFWSNDRAAVLDRFEMQVSEWAASVIAFDFQAVEDLELFFRDTGQSYEEIRRASDEALERAIDDFHARGG
jgi:hypothetical protein